MDWATRKVLAWRISNTLDADFCIKALKEALAKYGTPEIFNTDQGSQFTSYEFTQVLKDADVKISMDGRGRWIDNRMIERLWPLSWFAKGKPLPCNGSLKYERVYIRAFETGSEAKKEIRKWLAYYNTERPHSTHSILTPSEVYDRKTEPTKLAA